MPSPSGTDTTPFFVIANARASGLITLAAAGQAPGAAGGNPAAPGELRDQISAQPGTARTAGGQGQQQAASLRLPNTAFRAAAQTRKRNMPYPAILDLFAGLGHCLASPLASRRLDRPSQRRPVVGLLARMPSLSRPIIMQDTHPRAVLQSRGGSVPLDHGSAGSASPLPREFVLLFRIIHLAGCSASRVFTWTLPCCLPRQKLFCLLSSRSRSSKSDRQTRRGPAHTLLQHRQAGRSRPGELSRQRASACSAKISAPLVIYETTLGGASTPTPPSREPYIPAGTARADFMSAASCPPSKLSHARCRPRRSFIGPSPLSLAWSPLTTVISGSKEP